MIYLVRHGQAAASWGEHPNPGLSPDGRDQARAVAQSLMQQSISSVVSSPMQRCQDTAAEFANTSGLPARIDDGVTEIPTPNDVADRVSWLQNLMSGTWSAAPELITTWRDRLIDTVERIPTDTVVFSHFVAINAIVGHLEGTDQVTVFRPTYCSVTVLNRIDGRLQLVQRGSEATTKVL